MLKLKIILQYKKFYIFLLFISLFYAIINPLKKGNSNLNESEKYFTGIIKEFSIDGDKLDLTIKLSSSHKVKGTYYIKSEDELNVVQNNIKLGVIVNLEGTLNKPTNNAIPGTFNYKKYLENKNIYYLLAIDKYEVIKKENIFYRIKNAISGLTDNNSKTHSYLKAFVLGNNKEIDDEVTKSYRINGVTHLFAISGMHIGLLTVILSKLLDKFKIERVKKLFIMILFIGFYGFITGFASSFLRASLFFILVNTFKCFKINIEIKYIFYLTISILLIFKPLLLYDIGFEYSVMTSYGIILSAKYLNTSNKLVSLFKVSLIAFLFSFPITLFYFYEVNILAIINNLFFVPLISSLLFPLCLLTYFIPITNSLLNIVITITEKISLFLAKYFVISFNIPLNIISLVSIYLILVIAFHKKLKYLLFIILISIIIKVKPLFDQNAYIYYLDVGQGDSALIITPYRKDIILIDTGGKVSYQKDDWAKRSINSLSDNIITFLKSKGITTINQLIITHGGV